MLVWPVLGRATRGRRGPRVWCTLPQRIENFQWQWGHASRIRVKEGPATENEEEDSSPSLICTEVLEDKAVPAGNSFTVTIPHSATHLGWPSLFGGTLMGTGKLWGSYAMGNHPCQASSAAVRRAVNKLQQKEDFTLTMTFGDRPERDPLIILST